MFHRIQKLKPFKQAIFSLLIGCAVVTFWKGVWGLLEVYLHMGSQEINSWVALFIGLFILAITHYWTKELA